MKSGDHDEEEGQTDEVKEDIAAGPAHRSWRTIKRRIVRIGSGVALIAASIALVVLGSRLATVSSERDGALAELAGSRAFHERVCEMVDQNLLAAEHHLTQREPRTGTARIYLLATREVVAACTDPVFDGTIFEQRLVLGRPDDVEWLLQQTRTAALRYDNWSRHRERDERYMARLREAR